MSKIIFLNGCGSSGKTSIARSLQHLSDELWLRVGIDTFISMTPIPIDGQKETGYFRFIAGKNERGPTMHLEKGLNADQLFGLIPRFCELLAKEGNNLIIDEVLLDDDIFLSYIKHLSHHTVYYVGVFCELLFMQEREILRRDRCIGLANDQIDRVHQSIRAAYDFSIDTSNHSSFECARQILDFIKVRPAPIIFKKYSSLHPKDQL